MNAHYRHTQVGWVTLGAAAALAAFAWATLPAGAPATPLVVIAAAIALLFGTLTVEVDHEAVRLRFGVGLVRKRIALADVQAWDTVRNPLYAGWGIHGGPGFVIWNVSGLEGVELDLGTPRRFRIGTDEPEALAAAIARTKGVSAPMSTSTLWRAAPGRASSPGRWLVWLAILAIGAGLVVWVFRTQMRPPEVHAGPEGLRVETLFYGASFPADDIVSISLEQRLPRILARTNGFAGAGSLRGWFQVQGWGKGRLYVDEGMAPYVVVRLRDGFAVVNFREPARTVALYDDLARRWPDRAPPR